VFRDGSRAEDAIIDERSAAVVVSVGSEILEEDEAIKTTLRGVLSRLLLLSQRFARVWVLLVARAGCCTPDRCVWIVRAGSELRRWRSRGILRLSTQLQLALAHARLPTSPVGADWVVEVVMGAYGALECLLNAVESSRKSSEHWTEEDWYPRAWISEQPTKVCEGG
jgi:hypothetical protein